MCTHNPQCPPAFNPDGRVNPSRQMAHTVSGHPEQGWSLLCNGVVIQEDLGEILPTGQSHGASRPTDLPAPGERHIYGTFDGHPSQVQPVVLAVFTPAPGPAPFTRQPA